MLRNIYSKLVYRNAALRWLYRIPKLVFCGSDSQENVICFDIYVLNALVMSPAYAWLPEVLQLLLLYQYLMFPQAHQDKSLTICLFLPEYVWCSWSRYFVGQAGYRWEANWSKRPAVLTWTSMTCPVFSLLDRKYIARGTKVSLKIFYKRSPGQVFIKYITQKLVYWLVWDEIPSQHQGEAFYRHLRESHSHCFLWK